MQQKDSVIIGPRTEFLIIALFLTPILLYALFAIDEFSNFYIAGRAGFVVAGTAYFWWVGGHSLMVDESGIHQRIYGIQLRSISWNAIQDVLCYPNLDDGRLDGIFILIRLKGCRGAIPDRFDLTSYHMRHIIKTLYINYDNYTSVIGQYAELTYCKGWGGHGG